MTFTSDIYKQNDWANEKIVEFCRSLGEDVLDATAEGTYGTIRDTLVHIAFAQERYVARLSGESPEGLSGESDGFPGWDRLMESLRRTGRELARLAEALDADRYYETEYQGRKYRVDNGVVLVQAINHATEHRTQIKTILSSLGHEPPDLDSWTWAEEAGKLTTS